MKEAIAYIDEIGDGQANMSLTDEEVIRCRDCKRSCENGWKCTRFSEEQFDIEQEIGELVIANVRPDGFCAWAERGES